MIGDEIAARDFSQGLIARGVYAVNFSFPVVPRGTARIRTQMSAAHSTDDLDFAVAQFVAVRERLEEEAYTRPAV
jgi:glycine C-acetyltransferase